MFWWFSCVLILVCSGQALAEQGTTITIARLLWGFDYLKCKGPDGKPIDIDIFDYTNGLNWRPQPFKCIIRPRNETIAATVKREGAEALTELQQYNGTTKYPPLPDSLLTFQISHEYVREGIR